MTACGWLWTSVKEWHYLSIKNYYHFYGANYLARGSVISHMVDKKNKKTDILKTYFMTFGNCNLNGLLGLSAAGALIIFIDDVPLSEAAGGSNNSKACSSILEKTFRVSIIFGFPACCWAGSLWRGKLKLAQSNLQSAAAKTEFLTELARQQNRFILFWFQTLLCPF